jgi:hypothetical protein
VKNYDEVEYKRGKKEEEARRLDQEKWDSKSKVSLGERPFRVR